MSVFAKVKLFNERLSEWMSIVAPILSIIVVGVGLAYGLRSTSDRPLLSAEAERRELLVELEKQRLSTMKDLARLEEQRKILQVEASEIKVQLNRLLTREAGAGSVPDALELRGQLLALKTSIDGFSIKIQGVERRTGGLEKRLGQLEATIQSDPQKALGLPLLKRDVDSLQQRTTHDVETLRSENARVYDLMKWLVGLMALVSLSLVGTAVSNVFKRESRGTEPK